MVQTITVFVEIAPEITNFYLLGNWKLLGNLCSSQNTINSTQYDETNSERAFLKFLQSVQNYQGPPQGSQNSDFQNNFSELKPSFLPNYEKR